MRILWLSHFVPFPPTSGALQRSYHLLRYAATRHEIHLLALHQPRLVSGDDAVRTAVDALSEHCSSIQIIQLPAERSSAHRLFAAARSVADSAPFDAVWLRSAEMHAALSAWLKRHTVDLFHVDTVGLWPYVAKRTQAPIILSHHNIESDLGRRRAAHERLPWRSAFLRYDADKLRRLEARAARAATMNLVVSSIDAERLGHVAPGAAIELVDNGVDSDFLRPANNDGEHTDDIVFVGTLGWYPNRDAVDFLLSSIWPALLAGNPNRRLRLVGRDPGPAALAAASDPRIQVTGFVPDVRPYIASAGIYVCPIRIGGGTRLKVLDALAMAKPLVATTAAVEGLDVVEGRHYLHAETAEEFVEQIHRLDHEPELRRVMGAAGRQLVVDRYDWRVIGRQLDTAYARAAAIAKAGGRKQISVMNA